MPKIILILIVLLFSLLNKQILRGQSNNSRNYRFQYFMIEDGLPQNTITCIAKDHYGFMWFGTNNGICRYDSYNFELFQADESNRHALPDNLIRTITPGTHNLVWVGSLKGLSYFDHDKKQITQFTDSSAYGEPIRKVSSIVSIKNKVWVATENQGVFLLQKQKDSYRIQAQYCQANNKLANNQVNVLYQARDGNMLAGSSDGYFIFDSINNKFIEPESDRILPPQSNVNDIYDDKHKNLYFATNNGLFIHHFKNKTLNWHPSTNNTNTLVHSTVNMVRQDVSGQILVASLGGLQSLDLETGIFSDFGKDGPENFSINNEFVNALFCDSSGNIWIGTEKGGINKFNIYQNPLSFYTNNPNNPNSLNNNTINSVLRENNNLWIGTAGGGLNLLNIEQNKFSHFTYSATNSQTLSSDYVTSIVRGKNGVLYVGTWGGGLNALTTHGNRITIDRITLSDPNYKNDLVDGFVSSLSDNPLGYLLIGTQGGLSMLNYHSHKFTTLKAPFNHNPQLTEIGCVILDSKGYYWIGTRNGLFRFPQSALRETKDDDIIISQLEFYKHKPNNEWSLPGDYVISLMEDSSGDIWIGTYGHGLAHSYFNLNGELVFKTYTSDDGIANNVVYGIQEDRHKKIWISTDYGLSVLNTRNNVIRNFFKQDGLLNNQFYWSASHKSEDGIMYFGGIQGLNYFNPDHFYDYTLTPTPKITRLKIYNQEVNPGEKFHKKVVITKPIYDVDTIFLTYKDNNISFDFSAFDYYQPEKSRYAYKMSEVDKEWVNVSSQRRFASYNNLEGGTYTFLLRASNCDGIWTEEPTQVTIIVTPPFYKTIWFAIALFLFVTLLTYLFIRYQMRRIILQKKILEEKVQRRTQKIEDQKVILEQQANELIETNHQLENRQIQIEHQKEELESKNAEISKQRDELIVLNQKVNEINLLQLRFFTNISHEFQTPLTLILSPIERLLRQFKDDKETHHLLNIINRNALRLLMLIRQLLEIRKIETGNQSLQVELTETKAFLLEIFKTFEELAQKNQITYTHDIQVSQTAWIDKEKLENILYNLLSNAFKFTPQGQSIQLKASSKKENLYDILTLRVSDTGEGIEANQITKLFDRFLQVTESRKHKRAGTGIGLSMVKSLVEIMYGTISVESEPGKGSSFTIEIPVNRSVFASHEIDTTGQIFESNLKDKVALLSEQIIETKAIEYNSHGDVIEKVLVIEDNTDMRSFICSNLAPYFATIEAENGSIGYELAKKESPSIIISDIMMPEMDGLELCKKIKNNFYTSHIPIILLTARITTDEQIEGIKQGADDYMVKPFNMDLLLAKIKGFIENRNKLRAKFGKLEDVNPDELTLSKLDSRFFTKANEVVLKFYTDPTFDVDQFASEMFVSRSQLYNKLKAITNLSANEFINTCRLKKAHELLQQGELQVSEIAYATGFNDPKYFSRIFKKYYKQAPSDLVKKRI